MEYGVMISHLNSQVKDRRDFNGLCPLAQSADVISASERLSHCSRSRLSGCCPQSTQAELSVSTVFRRPGGAPQLMPFRCGDAPNMLHKLCYTWSVQHSMTEQNILAWHCTY